MSIASLFIVWHYNYLCLRARWFFNACEGIKNTLARIQLYMLKGSKVVSSSFSCMEIRWKMWHQQNRMKSIEKVTSLSFSYLIIILYIEFTVVFISILQCMKYNLIKFILKSHNIFAHIACIDFGMEKIKTQSLVYVILSNLIY